MHFRVPGVMGELAFRALGQSIAIIAALLIGLPRSGHAVDIKYALYSYGDQHAILMLTGDVRGIAVHPSSDGLSARVSGVGVTFSAPAKPAATNVVTAIRPVRRGAFTDLVMTFATTASVSAAPTKSGLKIFIRVGKSRTPVVEASPGPSAAPHTNGDTGAATTFPAKITFGSGAAPGDSSATEQITIVFPESAGLVSASSFSEGLRWGAYAADLLWSWAIGQRLQYSDPLAPTCRQSSPASENTEVEQLIGALTKELAEVRIQLEAKEGELKALQESPRHLRDTDGR